MLRRTSLFEDLGENIRGKGKAHEKALKREQIGHLLSVERKQRRWSSGNKGEQTRNGLGGDKTSCARIWRGAGIPLIGEQINMWSIHTRDYYSALGRKG